MERIVVIKIKLNDNKKFLIIKTRRSGQKKILNYTLISPKLRKHKPNLNDYFIIVRDSTIS